MRPNGIRNRGALAALMLAAAPAAAIPTKAPSATAPASARDAVRRALELGQGGDCTGALALVDPLVPALAPGAERSAAQLVRLSCLGAVGRGREVVAVQQELAGALPKNPYVRSMGVLVAAADGRFDDAAVRLAAIAETAPDALALIPADSWRGIEQKLVQGGRFAARDTAVIALARADWQPAERPELRDTLAQGAIAALLAQGQREEATQLLGRVTMPELLSGMAIERLYQPLWPAIEARMGAAQARAADRFAATRLDAFARTPDDPHALRDAVRAFGLLGRYPEASEIAAGVSVAEGMDEDAAAVVLYDAQVMQAAGRVNDAIARLKPFAALDPAKTPVAGSALVQLAEMLDEANRPQEALDVARAALSRGQETLSPWGEGWLHRTELCTLTTLGRTAEAAGVGDRLKAHVADNEAAAIEGLLCARRTAEAASIALATLATAQGAGDIADQFQPDAALWIAAPSRLRALWGALLARADVKAAFEKRARVLPRTLWPSRTPRPIPHAPGGGADDTSPTT